MMEIVVGKKGVGSHFTCGYTFYGSCAACCGQKDGIICFITGGRNIIPTNMARGVLILLV